MNYRIGIIIGKVNISAVLAQNDGTIVATCKVTTTQNISQGVLNVLLTLHKLYSFDKQKILCISIGTTYITNTILQGSKLCKVGVIRIAGYKPLLPPMYSWNEKIRNAVYVGEEVIDGGYNYDGSCITRFSISEARYAINKLRDKGAEGLAVVGIFSPVYHEQEDLVGNQIKEMLGKDFSVTLSHKIGEIGYIERENSAILNTALIKAMKVGFDDLQSVLRVFGLTCPAFVTQNNGAIITLEEALRYPILITLSSSTNSLIGAARLACESECIVAHIGTVSTKVGIVLDNFPQCAFYNSSIANIALNCLMPEILSIELGGSSCIRVEGDEINIGPENAECMMRQYAKGGSKITLTDMAHALGHINLSPVKFTEQEVANAKRVMSKVVMELEELYQRVSGLHTNLPFIIIGSGAKLLASPFLPKHASIPKYAEFAGAYGAAFAEVSTTEDIVVALIDEESTLKSLRNKVKNKMSQSYKIDPSSVRVVREEVIPYNYVPNNIARVRVVAASSIMP